MSDIPRPREVYDWVGPEAVERAFAEAFERGRLHHAWLLVGPPGVGKATFAYRAARRLLGAAPEPTLGVLGSRPDDPTCRLVAGRAHPDLLVLQLDPEDGKTRKNIPAEEARLLGEFYSKSPARADHRVAIVDAADDLNDFGVNALLKTLEEPPERGVLLLVASQPGALLSTVRSRCRRLRIPPPKATAAQAWLAARSGLPEEDTGAFLAMAGGAPGSAWRLAEAEALEADREVGALIAALPSVDDLAALAISDRFRGAAGVERFALAMDRLAAKVREEAERRIARGGLDPGRQAARWAEAWSALQALRAETEAVNLDRAETFHVALARLAEIA